jgi:hypothetical protein
MRQTKTLGLGGWVGGGLLAALALACLGAPVICRALGLEPEAVDLLAASLTPSWDHPMGTDDRGLGRSGDRNRARDGGGLSRRAA